MSHVSSPRESFVSMLTVEPLRNDPLWFDLQGLRNLSRSCQTAHCGAMMSNQNRLLSSAVRP